MDSLLIQKIQIRFINKFHLELSFVLNFQCLKLEQNGSFLIKGGSEVNFAYIGSGRFWEFRYTVFNIVELLVRDIYNSTSIVRSISLF